MFDSPSQPTPGISGKSSFGLGVASGDPAYQANATSTLPVPPAAAAPPPMFGADTGPGKRPGRKPSGGSFMGTSALIPSAANLGSNTLLGQ